MFSSSRTSEDKSSSAEYTKSCFGWLETRLALSSFALTSLLCRNISTLATMMTSPLLLYPPASACIIVWACLAIASSFCCCFSSQWSLSPICTFFLLLPCCFCLEVSVLRVYNLLVVRLEIWKRLTKRSAHMKDRALQMRFHMGAAFRKSLSNLQTYP